ncbi:MAG: hypothetical protein OJF58_001211 [Enhydrobacter sp.]|nr:MAG: hypothetical protein OJF58_001211 [Enhydrobacter sp.]
MACRQHQAGWRRSTPARLRRTPIGISARDRGRTRRFVLDGWSRLCVALQKQAERCFAPLHGEKPERFHLGIDAAPETAAVGLLFHTVVTPQRGERLRICHSISGTFGSGSVGKEKKGRPGRRSGRPDIT